MATSTPDNDQVARQTVTLLVGLFVVCGLLFISVLAIANPWLGLVVGAVELVVAWGVDPPSGARPLPWLAGLLGVLTLGYAVTWLLFV